MATGRGVRSLMGPLLAVNFVVYLIILGLAGWSIDKYIDGEQNHPHLGGNPSTSFMLIFALIAGVTGACCAVTGFLHYRAWRSDSLAAAASSVIISWAITALALGVQSSLQGDDTGRPQRKAFANIGSLDHNINSQPITISAASPCWIVQSKVWSSLSQQLWWHRHGSRNPQGICLNN